MQIPISVTPPKTLPMMMPVRLPVLDEPLLLRNDIEQSNVSFDDVNRCFFLVK